jgi:hypothetical protein
VVVALVLAVVVITATGGSGPLRAPPAPRLSPPAPGDPLRPRAGDDAALVSRAIAGEGHALFGQSPGGAVATAARVSRVRALVDAAAAGSGIDPDLLEGLVFVESAGRPDAVAGGDPAGAAGLTQILPGTATSMLGLRVDVAASRRLTQAIAHDDVTGASAAAIAHLTRERAAVDQRFAPASALAATVRYLELARARFGREDLAFAAYHMGMGNLTTVLDLYDGGRPVSYAHLFFDTAPDRHPAAYRVLAGFSDQSWLYLWRVEGAAALMHLYRGDRAALVRLTRLQDAEDSSAEVLHPPDRTPGFADPAALSAAYADGTLVPLPANPAQLGLSYTSALGAQAGQLHAPGGLYRGLRPAARTLLLQLAARVRALDHGQGRLLITSAVTDRHYQARLQMNDPPAAAGYSFTIARSYVSGAQAGAFQAMLDRLQALNLIAWTAYPAEIEVTVASDAGQVIAHGV